MRRSNGMHGMVGALIFVLPLLSSSVGADVGPCGYPDELLIGGCAGKNPKINRG